MSGFDFHGLTASFNGERVIGPLSLHVNEGEHVALVGKSGAGKSTLIRLLYDRLESEASLIPQGLGLVNALPVFHNVFMGQLDRHPGWYNALTLIRPFRRDRDTIKALLKELEFPRNSGYRRLHCLADNASGWPLPGPSTGRPLSCWRMSPFRHWMAPWRTWS